MSSEPKAAAATRLVSLGDEDAVREILSATVLDLWKVVNNLTRLRPSKRERYRVAIFGSARRSPARSFTTKSGARRRALPRWAATS